MTLISWRDIRKVSHPHYIINVLLALSYILLKTVKPICSFLFDYCRLEHKESEILFFTAVIIIFRTRKQGAVNFFPYIGTACMIAKLGNVILFFLSDPLYGIVYILSCLFHMLLLPEPSYQGPENIVYFSDEDLKEELKNRSNTWIIELYACWSPSCIEFASTFSELSANFTLDNLKFGKIDLARNPETAARYKINTSSLSKQIPTLILFKNGREEMRRPIVGPNKKLIPFPFNYESVISTFDLHNLYKQCKEQLSKLKTTSNIYKTD